MATDDVSKVYEGQPLRDRQWEAARARDCITRMTEVFGDFSVSGEQHLAHLTAAQLRRVGRAAATLLGAFDDPCIWGWPRDVANCRRSGYFLHPLCNECARTLVDRERKHLTRDRDQ